ncbi:hypothetical protein BH09MYX1_BH09MYX1_29520 [soil metagenome]
MAESVDLSHAVTFHLPTGTVLTADDAHAAVVPTSALAELVRSSPTEARSRFGQSVGEGMGKRIAKRVGGAAALMGGDIELVTTHLAAEIALAGLGTLAIERWGRALVFHWSGVAVELSEVLNGILEGALASTSGRNVACILLSANGGMRILATNEDAAGRVRGWMDDGVPWAEALTRLQGGAS